MKASLKSLADDVLVEKLEEIAFVLRSTVAMPRAAEAIEEAANRLKVKQDAHH